MALGVSLPWGLRRPAIHNIMPGELRASRARLTETVP